MLSTKISFTAEEIEKLVVIKVSATLQDRPRADRYSACVSNKNPCKPRIF